MVYAKGVQLKFYQDPSLVRHIWFTFLVIDEAQHLAPSIAYVFNQKVKHHKSTTMLRYYDINQSIYLFMKKIVSVPSKSHITFTMTFRFGEEIASYANHIICLILYLQEGRDLIALDPTDASFIV